MAKLSVKIKGLKEVEKLFGKEGVKAVEKEIEEQMRIAAFDVDKRAVDRLSQIKNTNGHLRRSMKVDGKGLKWVISNNANYSGYVEFGTKTRVQVPPEMQEQADKFRGGGGGSYKDFKENIQAWMRMKGIPGDALYPIMAKILRVGIDPQPFMYPSFKEGTKNLAKDIDDAIQDFFNRK